MNSEDQDLGSARRQDDSAASGDQQSASTENEIERLAKLYADDFEEFTEDDTDAVSLEDLSSSYAQAMRQEMAAKLPTDSSDEIEIFDPLEEELANKPTVPVSPIAVVESVLMVGRPDGSPISATEIAALMRGVTESEVDQLVQQLNEDYIANDRALRIALIGGAYKMQLSDELMSVRDQFFGPAREIRLNQAAIDCLALVAYQPGISRDKLDEQRGQSSGSVLNQLVRRELLEVRRQKADNTLRPHYYPTARLLELAGLESLEDLPTVEDWNG
jgi:segregation and condensation protein B